MYHRHPLPCFELRACVPVPSQMDPGVHAPASLPHTAKGTICICVGPDVIMAHSVPNSGASHLGP